MKLPIVLIALCLSTILTGCRLTVWRDAKEAEYAAQRASYEAREKARMMPFEEIKDFNAHLDGEDHYSLVCDRSTGVVYLKYNGWRRTGLTVYLDENLQPVRCEKTVQ